jgi:hypothetical protein
MSDHLGWAPPAGTCRERSGGSLGSAIGSSKAREHVAPEGFMRICARCRTVRLAALNPGPCHRCRSMYRVKNVRTETWCLVVPVGTPLPVPQPSESS